MERGIRSSTKRSVASLRSAFPPPAAHSTGLSIVPSMKKDATHSGRSRDEPEPRAGPPVTRRRTRCRSAPSRPGDRRRRERQITLGEVSAEGSRRPFHTTSTSRPPDRSITGPALTHPWGHKGKVFERDCRDGVTNQRDLLRFCCQYQQQVATLDGGRGLDRHTLDDPGQRRRDRRFHLHRLDGGHGLSGQHAVARAPRAR